MSRRWVNKKGEFDNTCGDYLSSAFRRNFLSSSRVMTCKILDNGVIALLFIKLTEKRYEIFIS